MVRIIIIIYSLQTAKEESTLKCYFRPTRIPYYRGKEEVLNAAPRVSRFHDVISDREIQMLRSFATDGVITKKKKDKTP